MYSINLQSSRSKKSRVSIVLDKKWLRVMLMSLGVLSFVAWIVTSFYFDKYLGHVLIVIWTWSIMPVLWYHGELKLLLPVVSLGNSKSLDDVLDRRILGKLSNPMTVPGIVEVLKKSPGGIFYTNRFGVSFDFIITVIPDSPASINKILHDALELAKIHTKDSVINDVTFACALLLNIPNCEYYFSQLNLDKDEIISAIAWKEHQNRVYQKIKDHKKSGGLGRDFSFGWSPLLNKVGTNISESIENGHILHRQIEGHDEVINQMQHVLSQAGRRNACLVGEVGVGKTTLVYALAQRLLSAPKNMERSLRYKQIVELNAATLLARSRGSGEMESLLIRIFNEAIHAKNIIIFLDEAQLFLENGVGSVDLSSILLPVLEGGALPLITSMTDQQWLKLSQSNPALAQLLNRITVNPLDEDDTLRVMEDQIMLFEGRGNIVYMKQSLKEAYKLAQRFIRDQEFPGKALKLLESAMGFAEDKYFITAKSIQLAVEKSVGVKVQVASTEQERDVLLNLEGKIHERMINQSHAVKVVGDALRRARAGVRNQNKPIGTFLFLGPTGVGKTELSKALADVYFGGEDHLVRLDLNEFSRADDVSRLIEVGATNSTSLTAQISKQPFSVVLLDEIEKAHPNVLNVLLQLLDEGMMRDSDNKEVSFRDAVVIATSNAGADKIRAHIESGESLEQFEDTFIDELIDSNIFRPEFINRFDEIALFRPLDVNELKQVVDLIVNAINKTLASQKIRVELTDDAKTLLANNGYDPRLGARPLRRTVQRSIENIMAQKLLSSKLIPGSVVALDAPEIKSSLDVRN